MSWTNDVYRIGVSLLNSGSIKFKVTLYDKYNQPLEYVIPLFNTCDDAWERAQKLERDVGKKVLDMFVEI